VGRERGRDAAQHQPVPQPGSLTRSRIHDGLVLATVVRGTRRRNAFCFQEVARIRRATDGAAFYAAPDSSSDQHGNGTQDVNDPASGPAMRPQGRSGVVHVLGSACRSHRTDEQQSRRIFPASRAGKLCRKPRAFWALKMRHPIAGFRACTARCTPRRRRAPGSCSARGGGHSRNARGLSRDQQLIARP
jgi:hypothetical protein